MGKSNRTSFHLCSVSGPSLEKATVPQERPEISLRQLLCPLANICKRSWESLISEVRAVGSDISAVRGTTVRDRLSSCELGPQPRIFDSSLDPRPLQQLAAGLSKSGARLRKLERRNLQSKHFFYLERDWNIRPWFEPSLDADNGQFGFDAGKTDTPNVWAYSRLTTSSGLGYQGGGGPTGGQQTFTLGFWD